MLEIPLYTFLFLYFLYLALFAALYLVIIYHIAASASLTFASFVMSFFIFAATTLTLYATMQLLVDADWRHVVATLDLQFLKSIVGQ